ncbi:MAG: tRNA uridine-5-carboxymethylaminomethyl(34) synthesis GTPase MnmE [Ferruginibacter sp.]
MEKWTGWDDTIVAPITPAGTSAIAVVRVSGRDTIKVVQALFPSKNLTQQQSHTLHYGTLSLKGNLLDEVLLSLFKAPNSYTGEDSIEISTHGNPLILQKVLDALVQQGARMAQPGEFTQRAFLNGKLDLAQAESVADLIHADSEAAQKSALHGLRGGFSKTLHQLREQLIRFASLIELELDFATEDVEFADRSTFLSLIEEIDRVTRTLIDSFILGNVVRNGIRIAIIGKPNAGKSTLLNALLNEERAIVSDIAGTTRDTVEESLIIDGIRYHFIDTAGIREESEDVIERIGIAKSLEKMRSADLVLYVYDLKEETAEQIESAKNRFKHEAIRYLLIANKADLVNQSVYVDEDSQTVFLAAKSGLGIDVLKKQIQRCMLGNRVHVDQTVVTNARHLEALQKLQIAIDDIRHGLSKNRTGDLLAIDIRTALTWIGEITGEVTSEDKLDYIFSKFCIGK